jgi:hypothetical protein
MSLEIKTYSGKELREKYNISWEVFRDWLAPIAADLKLRPRQRIFSPEQVSIIIKHYGNPC